MHDCLSYKVLPDFILQIEYLDSHETNGFEINVDNDATLSCVVTTSGDEETMKHNTCHTSGVIYLQKGLSSCIKI